MASQPTASPVRLRLHPAASPGLRPLRAGDAECVAAWAPPPPEMFWLAPRSCGPLTAAMITAWTGQAREALVFEDRSGGIAAYGELNVLNGWIGSFWLGHLLVDPARRGQGLGRALTRALLGRAFEMRRALRVSLVVFPDNAAAIRCYESVGMKPDGFEEHDFPLHGRRARLIRMAITLRDWLARGDR